MSIDMWLSPIISQRLSELEHVFLGCANATAEESTDWLLVAYRVLAQSQQLQTIELPDSADFLALVAVGGLESATLSLLPAAAGYMVSRGPSGATIASVILPGVSMESTAEGDGVTLALLGALFAAILSSTEARMMPATGKGLNSPISTSRGH